MENGWGLTVDSSNNKTGFFGNKPVFGFQLSPRLMNPGSSAGMFFPVTGAEVLLSNNIKGEKATSSPEGDQRVVIGEVDFFADKRIRGDDVVVKKEDSHAEPHAMDVNTGLQLVTANTGSTDQSTIHHGVSSDIEGTKATVELAKLQIELEKMKGENQKLREMLTHVNSNYSTLQGHLMTLMQQQQHNSRAHSTQNHEVVDNNPTEAQHLETERSHAVTPRQLLDRVTSGTTEILDEPSNRSSSEERTLSGSPVQKLDASRIKGIGREESPESEGWTPSKVAKLTNSHAVDHVAEATMRKARVSVRARSEAPMISDGCQWRKYGQKMAKGNPCPRAYYRCTMAVGCPVRKQVQRCAEDRGVLITTYEGTHNHPLPPAAMAMASTTSAAASMLISGSMSSSDGLMNPNILARTILPCSSNMATISASAPFPTVTLDLTRDHINPLQFQKNPPHFPLPLNFVHQGLYDQSKFSGLHLSPGIEAAHLQGHNYMQHPQMQQDHNHNASVSDVLSAATAAITADPNFTAVLAAAISSFIGGSHPSNNNTAASSETIATAQNEK